MRNFIVIFILSFSLKTVAQQANQALETVQKQLDFYNARNINEFANIFSEDVKVYRNLGDSIPYIFGKKELKKVYVDLFQKYPENKSTLKARIQQGNYIVDHEYITGRETPLEIVAIYEVKENKIVKCWFIR
jgi:hypothetical protein